MAVAKQPKVETKRPRKRNATKAKGTKAPKNTPVVETTAVSSPALDVPVAETPVAEATPREVPAAEVPVAEVSSTGTSAAEVPVADVPTVVKSTMATPVATDTSEEEIRKAKELLRAHGYGLIGYRDAGEKVKRSMGAGLDFVKGKWKSFGGWLSAKRDEIKAKQEERNRAAAEKKRLEDEEAARHAEAVKSELRLAELRVEEARLKAAAASNAMPPAEEPARQHVVELVGRLVAEKPQEAEVVAPVDPDVPKCGACGAELVLGARFCRKCGKPVSASVQSV